MKYEAPYADRVQSRLFREIAVWQLVFLSRMVLQPESSNKTEAVAQPVKSGMIFFAPRASCVWLKQICCSAQLPVSHTGPEKQTQRGQQNGMVLVFFREEKKKAIRHARVTVIIAHETNYKVALIPGISDRS